jgi:hypothetical protein
MLLILANLWPKDQSSGHSQHLPFSFDLSTCGMVCWALGIACLRAVLPVDCLLDKEGLDDFCSPREKPIPHVCHTNKLLADRIVCVFSLHATRCIFEATDKTQCEEVLWQIIVILLHHSHPLIKVVNILIECTYLFELLKLVHGLMGTRIWEHVNREFT